MKTRCDQNPDDGLFTKIKSSDLLTGGKYEMLWRNKGDLTLPTVKHVKTPQQWLERSNRLLEIVNKTSQIVQDMKRGGRQRGFYNVASSSCDNPHRNHSLERISRNHNNNSQSTNTLRQNPSKYSAESSSQRKSNPLKGMLLKKLENIRTKILIEADQIKLQKRGDPAEERDRVIFEKPCRKSKLIDQIQQPRTVEFNRPKPFHHQIQHMQNRTSEQLKRPKHSNLMQIRDKHSSSGIKIELLDWPKGRNISRLSPWNQDSPLVMRTEQSQYDP